jgi:hypothetical protein
LGVCVTRHIPNEKKLIRIIEAEAKPEDPFVFSVDEATRIRQLVGQGIAAFFAKLNDKPVPQNIPIPEEFRSKATKTFRRKRLA